VSKTQPQTTKAGNSYFPALDGLRLLASLNIVLMHLDASWCLGQIRDIPVIGYIVIGPLFNASLFFVLGGFIYFYQLAPKAATFRALPFLKRRIHQLYPLHILSLLLMVLVLLIRHQYYGNLVLLAKSALMHLTLLWAFDPNDWFALNQPSWALTPFFIAYATLGFWLKALLAENRRWVLVVVLLGTLVPSVVVAFLYTGLIDAPNVYEKFHMFPLVRVFEFYFGMVLARLFQVQRATVPATHRPWLRDFFLAAAIYVAWLSIDLHWHHGVFLSWFGHHTIAVVLYGWMVWQLAHNQGILARFFANPIVSHIGRSSFYPYLLHLPLIGLTIIIAKALGFQTYFLIWWQPWLWLVVLYGLSVAHVRRKSKKRKAAAVAVPVMDAPVTVTA